MYYVKRNLKNFSTAHRLVKGYKGKCKNLHGHNYTVSVTLQAKKLDEYDFVIDFDNIKVLFDSWVQDVWDHATLVCENDKSLIDFLKKEKQKFFILPGGKNTTVEALSSYLFQTFTSILDTRKIQGEFPKIEVVEVTIM